MDSYEDKYRYNKAMQSSLENLADALIEALKELDLIRSLSTPSISVRDVLSQTEESLLFCEIAQLLLQLSSSIKKSEETTKEQYDIHNWLDVCQEIYFQYPLLSKLTEEEDEEYSQPQHPTDCLLKLQLLHDFSHQILLEKLKLASSNDRSSNSKNETCNNHNSDNRPLALSREMINNKEYDTKWAAPWSTKESKIELDSIQSYYPELTQDQLSSLEKLQQTMHNHYQKRMQHFHDSFELLMLDPFQNNEIKYDNNSRQYHDIKRSSRIKQNKHRSNHPKNNGKQKQVTAKEPIYNSIESQKNDDSKNEKQSSKTNNVKQKKEKITEGLKNKSLDDKKDKKSKNSRNKKKKMAFNTSNSNNPKKQNEQNNVSESKKQESVRANSKKKSKSDDSKINPPIKENGIKLKDKKNAPQSTKTEGTKASIPKRQKATTKKQRKQSSNIDKKNQKTSPENNNRSAQKVEPPKISIKESGKTESKP
jgi:hypothetical protein